MTESLLLSLTLLLTAQAPSTEIGPIVFRDVAAEAGVNFRFDTGSRGKHDLVEIMGGGVGLIDADGDGFLDIVFCNGGPIVPEAGRADPPCRLFRNLGNWRFEDITARAGAPGPTYAMGVAVGDYDNDGRDDLFVTGWRDQRLYRNLGGRFEDVSKRAGVASNAWSTSAAFADLDDDGDLDLYVCNYLDYDPARAPFCAAPDGKRDYCGPEVFPAQAHRLYRNNGDGTFTDISREAGVALEGGRGLGVLVADVSGDRKLDVFVANDGSPCWLFENRGGLKFKEIAERAGVAVDGAGQALAAMGVALGDIDGDGLNDLVVGNFLDRSTIAFRQLKRGLFADVSARIGLAKTTRSVLGFGVVLEDFDGDGDLDLLQMNGHVLDRERLGVPFAMRPIILKNEGGRFVDVSASSGPALQRKLLGRGLAVGDLDNDSRPDAVAAALDGNALLLRNETRGGHYVPVELGPRGHRSPVGVVVRANVAGKTINRTIIGGGSYLSAPSRRISLGIGASTKVDRIEVQENGDGANY